MEKRAKACLNAVSASRPSGAIRGSGLASGQAVIVWSGSCLGEGKLGL